jgi:hypothetical protein
MYRIIFNTIKTTEGSEMDNKMLDNSTMSSQDIIKQVVKWRRGGANRPNCIKRIMADFPDMDNREAKQIVDTAWIYN